ncbi:hypothetical protein Lal_00024560 [Lupinus albus]|uniref:Uncharacterized protein n=1 Tax=Lupinus albus TaxID=3870 RepID=A0A6A5NU31_LUPAL|nr:hypothetical protein Lalb_Chr10g0100621 [Lupinus albus]KAF1889238.1 hypothetical protein Lal_00024560 [Lupinus albus]
MSSKAEPIKASKELSQTERVKEKEIMDGDEAEKSNIPRLSLFKFNPSSMHSPERSGMKTPPSSTSVSIPFWWEEEPGKPKPCTDLVCFSNKPTTPKCLELPPRLLINDANHTKQLHSPTTVLEGHFVDDECNGSFAAERAQHGTMVVTNGVVGSKEKGWFGSWREKVFKSNREVSGGIDIFPSSADKGADHIGGSHKRLRMTKVKHSLSSSNLSHAKSCVWTSISAGLKQVVPWKSKKQKKDGYGGLRSKTFP